ncbi:MAG: LuxR C-terminal-related transcriptional regulator [Myxococcota bacterium]
MSLGYSLDIPGQQWLCALCEAMSKLTGGAVSIVGMRASGFEPGAGPRVTQAHCVGDPSIADRLIAADREMGPAMVAETHGTMGGKTFLIMDTEDRFPEAVEVYRRVIRCEDVLILSAVDPNFAGVGVQMFSDKRLTLTNAEWDLFFRLTVHIAAADRLRRGLEHNPMEGRTLDDFDPAAVSQAIFDPKTFRVAHANALKGPAIEVLRDKARLADRARGSLSKTNPEEALEIWQGLVRGKWSLVDWFDSDGRRFVLARPNAPDLGDPRGLSEREMQVATFAATGESGKRIGYRLGISTGHVSSVLRSVMRKLDVKSQSELVSKLSPIFQASDERSHS